LTFTGVKLSDTEEIDSLEESLIEFIGAIHMQRGKTTRFFKELKAIRAMDVPLIPSSSSTFSPPDNLLASNTSSTSSQKRKIENLKESKQKSADRADKKKENKSRGSSESTRSTDDEKTKKSRGSSESAGSTSGSTKKGVRATNRAAADKDGNKRRRESSESAGSTDGSAEKRRRSSARLASIADVTLNDEGLKSKQLSATSRLPDVSAKEREKSLKGVVEDLSNCQSEIPHISPEFILESQDTNRNRELIIMFISKLEMKLRKKLADNRIKQGIYIFNTSFLLF